jgi:sugar lactone lactonase YvrE
MTDDRTEVLVDGLAFPEGPRWRDGRLWLTDQHARSLLALDPDGTVTTIAATDDLPGGIGWLPDGRLLVVYMTRRHIMQVAGGRLSDYADLSALASFHCNDMVVDRVGRAYVGNFGFDLHGGAAEAPAEVVLVGVDGRPSLFAGDLVFPNGSVIPPGGETLLVAETFRHRITAFGLDGDGRKASQWVWPSWTD